MQGACNLESLLDQLSEKSVENRIKNLSRKVLIALTLNPEVENDIEIALDFIGNNISNWKAQKKDGNYSINGIDIFYDQEFASVTIKVNEKSFDYDSLFIENHPDFNLSDDDFNKMHLFILAYKVELVSSARLENKECYLSTRQKLRENHFLPRSLLFLRDNATIIHLNKKTPRFDPIGGLIKGDTLLGKGGHKTVTTAVWLENNHEEFASASILQKTGSNAIENELRWLKYFKNNLDFVQMKAIASYRSIKSQDMKTRLLLEKIKGSDLLDVLDKRRLKQEEKIRITTELIRIISYMHDQNIVHLDIKPENFMITKDNSGQLIVKAIDLGSFKTLEEPKTRSGTLYYAAPEYLTTLNLKGNRLSLEDQQAALNAIDLKKADVWSLGLVITQIFQGELDEFSPKEESKPSVILQEKAALFDLDEPEDRNSIKYLVWQMLRVLPEDRIDMVDALNFFR